MKLDDLRLFIHVIKHGSFSAASKSLGVPAATLTRRIQYLERDLDARLLIRNARGLSLTNAGKNIWQKSNQVIFDLEGLSNEIHDDIHVMEGVITISAPTCFINEIIAPVLPPFLEKYPSVRLDFISEVSDDSSGRIFSEESVDLAFRFGPQKDSTLISRCLGAMEIIFTASPQYLQLKGEPQHPQELSRHELLGYRNIDALDFYNKDCAQEYIKAYPKIQCDDPDVLFKAAVSGLGIFPMPRGLYMQAQQQGELKQVLADWKGSDLDIHLVYLNNKYLPRRVRVLIDYLTEQWPGIAAKVKASTAPDITNATGNRQLT